MQMKCKYTGIAWGSSYFQEINKLLSERIEIRIEGLNISEKRKFEKSCYSHGLDITTSLDIPDNLKIQSDKNLSLLPCADYIEEAILEDPFCKAHKDGFKIKCSEIPLIYTTKYAYLIVKLIENFSNIDTKTDSEDMLEEREFLISHMEYLFITIFKECLNIGARE